MTALAIAGMASPVFVVGSPRSGTSILTSALLAGGYNGFREGNFLPLLQQFETVMEKHRQTYANGSKEVLASLVGWVDFRNDIEAAFKKQVDALNPISPWMDKSGNPEMIELIPKLLELWPSAIFVFAKRRAIENVVSRLSKFPGRTFDYHCRDWARNMTAWRSMRDLPGLNAIEIDQQDIAQTPGKTASQLGQFIGAGAEARDRISAVFVGDRPQQTKDGSATRVLDLVSTGWSDSQIDVFKTTCGAEMAHFHYSFDQRYWS